MGFVKRLITLGLLGLTLVWGAKSWLDGQRAELRANKAQELLDFHQAAALASCVEPEALLAAAFARGWPVSETGPQSTCTGTETATRWLHIQPKPAQFAPQGPGFVVAFDALGCLIAMNTSGCPSE